MEILVTSPRNLIKLVIMLPEGLKPSVTSCHGLGVLAVSGSPCRSRALLGGAVEGFSGLFFVSVPTHLGQGNFRTNGANGTLKTVLSCVSFVKPGLA